MSKLRFLFAFGFFLTACNPAEKTKATNSPVSDNPVTDTLRSLEAFADSLSRMDKFAMEGMDVLAAYYQRLVPADSAMADSAAVLFLQHVSGIVNAATERLYQDTTNYYNLVYNEGRHAPESQKQLQRKLLRSHILMQADGEGGVYAAPDYSWVNSVLQPKTSAAVDAYLALLAREEKNPALLDDGLAIEMPELVDRLVAAEKLDGAKLPPSFAEDLAGKHKFYRGLLLIGSDNSPSLEYGTIELSEQFRTGYAYLLSTYPTSKAAQLVKEWQAVVQTKDSKKVEEWRENYRPY